MVTGPGLLKLSYCNYLSWLGPGSRLITPGAPVPDHFSGLVLAGGGDVQASFYGGNPSLCELVDQARDDLDFGLLEIAVDRRVPVLGICRGIQVMNVHFGGTLVEHLEGHSARDDEGKKVDSRHEISVLAGTRLHAMLDAESLVVNSAHHQAIGELGKGLLVSALANDGTIEAAELPGEHFVLGVQWHPERDRNENDYNVSSLAIREAFLREVWLFDRQ